MEVPINDPNTDQEVVPDEKAKLEEKRIIEQMRLDIGDLERADQLRGALLEQAKYILFVTRFIIPFSILVLAWHYIFPLWLGWLTPKQLGWLQEISYGGFVISSISLAVQKYLSYRIPEAK